MPADTGPLAAAAAAVLRALCAINALDAVDHALAPRHGVKPAQLPTAALLAQHNIVLADDTLRRPHPHRAPLDAVAANIAEHRQHMLHPPSPPHDIARWASSPCGSATYAAAILAQHAYGIVYEVRARGPTDAVIPATAVTQLDPCLRDRWLSFLRTPLWDSSPTWGAECILGVGQECGGECGGDLPYCHDNVVGCLLPIRTQLGPDQPLHLGELFCAVLLLHRQLKWNRSVGSTVRLFPPLHLSC
jgi:hypothetical protein